MPVLIVGHATPLTVSAKFEISMHHYTYSLAACCRTTHKRGTCMSLSLSQSSGKETTKEQKSKGYPDQIRSLDLSPGKSRHRAIELELQMSVRSRNFVNEFPEIFQELEIS